MAIGQDLGCLNWHWGRVCGALIATEAGFVVPKVALGLCLWCLNWHRSGSVCPSSGFLVHSLLLLLCCLYSSGWSLASFTIRLQASRSIALSLHSFIASFLSPWTRHPANSFLVFLFVLLHTAFLTTSLLYLQCPVYFLCDQAIVFCGI